MSKKWATVIIVSILLVFIGFIVFDVALKTDGGDKVTINEQRDTSSDMWSVSGLFEPGKGKLKAIAVKNNYELVLGGDAFVACYDSLFSLKWELKTESEIAALAASRDTVFAASHGIILLINSRGEIINEWGPFESNAIITSVSANNSYVAFADAGNRIVFILNKKGEVRAMAGQTGEPFVIPSPYFDVALSAHDTLYVANTGHRRIETRNINGTLLGYFGEPGTAPSAFCGCCNPAHFIMIHGGFITAEKGINRIKIVSKRGEFTEFVSSVNEFVAPLPLDIASRDGKIIYGANPADSKVYVFKRKHQ